MGQRGTREDPGLPSLWTHSENQTADSVAGEQRRRLRHLPSTPRPQQPTLSILGCVSDPLPWRSEPGSQDSVTCHCIFKCFFFSKVLKWCHRFVTSVWNLEQKSHPAAFRPQAATHRHAVPCKGSRLQDAPVPPQLPKSWAATTEGRQALVVARYPKMQPGFVRKAEDLASTTA